MASEALDQDVQLSGSSLIQSSYCLTDQRAEVMAQLQDLVQAVEHWLQEDEGLGQQVTEEVIVGQSDALKVSGGVDLLQQLRELRLQYIHLQVVLQVVDQEGHVVA